MIGRNRDLDIVEALGSGIPRFLRAYGEECFKFTDNFIRITFPASVQPSVQVNSNDPTSDHASENTDIVTDKDKDHASVQVSVQVKRLLIAIKEEEERLMLQEILKIKNRDYFRRDYLNPAIESGYIELTIPDKPNSQHQKYRLTEKGVKLKENLIKQKKK